MKYCLLIICYFLWFISVPHSVPRSCDCVPVTAFGWLWKPERLSQSPDGTCLIAWSLRSMPLLHNAHSVLVYCNVYRMRFPVGKYSIFWEENISLMVIH